MLASLETLHEMRCRGRRVAVLGDMGEQGDASLEAHLEVGRHVPGSGVDQLFTVGKWASHIAAAAREAGLTAVQSFSDADSAGPAVRDFVRQGDVVLVKASRSMRLERISEILKNGSPAVKKGGC
jgi:UDP-N-acetylmuramoyl-tripeptide--D-alanyl-D-alanine ligase